MPHRWLLGKGLKDMSKKFCFLSITVKPVGRISQGKTSKWKQKRSSAWMSRRFGRPLKRRLKSSWISALKTAFWHSYAFLSRIHLPLIFPIFPGSRPRQCHGCQVVQAKAETKYAIKEAERAKQAQHGEKGNRQPEVPEVPEVFRLSSHF